MVLLVDYYFHVLAGGSGGENEYMHTHDYIDSK